MFRILVINPGSTSTKISVYENEVEIMSISIEHTKNELCKFKEIVEQLNFRKTLVINSLQENNIELDTLSCVVGRGGMLPPIKTGGYKVNQSMKDFLIKHPRMQHASNLGALIASEIAEPLNIPSYIYDAVVADEMIKEAKITGFPEIERQSFAHILNSRAVAMNYSKKVGKNYEDMNYVVAHMGGGVSVTAHSHGRIIDSVSDDAGPFSPDRSGSLNLMYLVELCYSGKYTKDEMMKKIRGEGGMKAHLGTHDLREVEKMISNGDKHALLIYKAQALQIAKGIGIMMCVFNEPIDAVILTGGLAYSEMLTDMISIKIENLLPVIVMPGEKEMEALAFGALRIMEGKETAKDF